jgi:hypothetical protein
MSVEVSLKWISVVCVVVMACQKANVTAMEMSMTVQICVEVMENLIFVVCVMVMAYQKANVTVREMY